MTAARTDETRKAFGAGVFAVAIAAGLVANAGSLIVPVFLPVLTHTRGMTEAQGGLFAMAEFGGVGIGALVCAMLPGLVEALNWRRTTALGLLVVMVGNVVMAAPMGFLGLFIVGLVAAVGAGLVNAVLFAILAEGDGARLMAVFTAAQLGFGTASVGIVSAIVARHGDAGAFLALAALAGVSLLMCPLLPRRGLARSTEEQVAPAEPERISGLGWMAALGLLIFSGGFGAIYGFLGYMGLAWGGKPAVVDSAIAGIMFTGMVGGLIVAAIGGRFGYLRPLALSTVGVVVGLLLFIVFKPIGRFLPVGGLIYFSACVATPYLFGVVTDIDRSSGAAMLMAACQVGGYAIGPAFAGYLVTPNYVPVNGFILGLFAVGALIVFAAVWLRQRLQAENYLNISARLEG